MEASKTSNYVSSTARDTYCPFIFWSRPDTQYVWYCGLQPSISMSDLEDTVFITSCSCSNHEQCAFYRGHLAESDM